MFASVRCWCRRKLLQPIKSAKLKYDMKRGKAPRGRTKPQ